MNIVKSKSGSIFFDGIFFYLGSDKKVELQNIFSFHSFDNWSWLQFQDNDKIVYKVFSSLDYDFDDLKYIKDIVNNKRALSIEKPDSESIERHLKNLEALGCYYFGNKLFPIIEKNSPLMNFARLVDRRLNSNAIAIEKENLDILLNRFYDVSGLSVIDSPIALSNSILNYFFENNLINNKYIKDEFHLIVPIVAIFPYCKTPLILAGIHKYKDPANNKSVLSCKMYLLNNDNLNLEVVGRYWTNKF